MPVSDLAKRSARPVTLRGFVPLLTALLALLPIGPASGASPPATRPLATGTELGTGYQGQVPSGSARVIVKFRANSSTVQAMSATGTAPVQQAQALSRRHGLLLTDGRPLGARTQLLHGVGLSSAALAQRLAQDPEVEYAEVDRRVRAMAVPNDPLYGDNQAGTTPLAGQWYLRPPNSTLVSAINAEAAWDVSTGSANVVVAVLDTGVRFEHPDMAGQLLPGYDFVNNAAKGNDGTGRDSDPSDPGDWVTDTEANTVNGSFYQCTDLDSTTGRYSAVDSSWHGTQTSGLVAALTNNGIGMASVGRNVKVLPLRVLGKCGGFVSDVVDAMRWAAGLPITGVPNNPVANRARVVNLSLGAEGACNSTFQNAVNELNALGVAVVVAAGNGNGFAANAPANCVGAIAVAGVRHAGSKVGYSNLGPELSLAAPAGNCVNTTGPCLYPIVSTKNDGQQGPVSSNYSTGLGDVAVGTSFSSPLVAGTVGLMMSANPVLTGAQTKVILQRTARAFPSTGGSPGTPMCQAPSNSAQDECYCTTSTCGAGMLDAGAALLAIQQARVFASLSPSTTAPALGQNITVTASVIAAGLGRSVTGYQWQVTNGSGSASIISGAGSSSVTVNISKAGDFTVWLTASDDQGHQDTQTLSLTASGASATSGGSGGGGGGALGWPEALVMALLACAGLAQHRGARALRRPGQPQG